MKSLVIAVLFCCLAAPAWAGRAEVIRVRAGARPTVPDRIHRDTAASASIESGRPRAGMVHKGDASVVLNCENDGTVEGALVIGVGDFVGNIFEVGKDPTPWRIEQLVFGLVDYDATYPALLYFDLYEDDGQGSFQPIGALDIEIESIPTGEADIFTVDVTEFNITGSRDILTLYGDGRGEAGRMLPAYDSSPRCFVDGEVCSVHLPADEQSLFVFGMQDAKLCPRAQNNILMFDLVQELVIGPAPNVATQPRSWGAVKADWNR